MQDIKHGGTPLHWAKNKEIVVALIEAGCLIDAKNFKGDAALHCMVRHSRLDCVMSLISYGANVNIKDASGSTPLHLAVETGDEIIVKALLIFDADIQALDEKNCTPWQVAVKKATTNASLMDLVKNREGVVYIMYSVGANGDEEMPDKLKQSRKASRVSSRLPNKRAGVKFSLKP